MKWFLFLLPSATYACLAMKPTDPGIPFKECPILAQWETGACEDNLTKPCKSATLTTTSVKCTTGQYTQVYMYGSHPKSFIDEAFAVTISCATGVGKWRVKYMFADDPVDEYLDENLEDLLGKPILVACAVPP